VGRRPSVSVRWGTGNDVEPVLSPAHGSWPNRIESEFAALRCLTPNGTDHRTRGERNAALAAYPAPAA